MGDDEKWAMQLQRPSVQATNRQQVFKPEHDDNLPSVKMVHLSEAQAEWSTQKYHDMYQEFLHTYNTLHQCGKNRETEREFDLNSLFISGNKARGIENQRSVFLSSTRSKMILQSLKKTTT